MDDFSGPWLRKKPSSTRKNSLVPCQDASKTEGDSYDESMGEGFEDF